MNHEKLNYHLPKNHDGMHEFLIKNHVLLKNQNGSILYNLDLQSESKFSFPIIKYPGGVINILLINDEVVSLGMF